MPSVSPFVIALLSIIYRALVIRCSCMITPTDPQSIENDNDITPWPLRSKKVKKSPSMPVRKSGRGGQEQTEKDRGWNRGFLGMNFLTSSRACGSSAGILSKD